jgi:hypothetical protein
MSTVHDDEMVVVRSLKAAFEQFGSPGSSMNSAGQNPFFLDARGAFDLLKTAKLVIANLDAHRALKAAAAKIEADKAALAAATQADSSNAGSTES